MNKSWVFYHDNAMAHSVVSVKTFRANYEHHSPYSPELAPCDLYLFFQRLICIKRNKLTKKTSSTVAKNIGMKRCRGRDKAIITKNL